MRYIHPRRYWNRLKRLFDPALFYMSIRKAWYRHLSSCKRVEGTWAFAQAGLMNGKGRIIGHDAQMGYYPSEFYFNGHFYLDARMEDALIEIGNSIINNNCVIVAEHGRIIIGDACIIGVNFRVINSDFHSICIENRHQGGQKSKDVIIGNNVFIGSNVSIMKGVTVGDNAVIANGSVVFDDVEANTVVRGNPAVFYKKLTR